MKNIIANLSLVFMMSMALVPSYAENLSEQVADNNRSVNPYEGSFSYDASSPVDIQLPNFSLTADSGSLLHGVDIQVSMLPFLGRCSGACHAGIRSGAYSNGLYA